MLRVTEWTDVPVFQNEHEEHEFWATHELAGKALDQMSATGDPALPPPEAFARAAPRTRPIAVRLDTDVLRRLKAIAALKQKGYQTLLKEFVMERLYEEEKREGVLTH